MRKRRISPQRPGRASTASLRKSAGESIWLSMGQELLSTGLSLLVILDVFLVERDKDDYAEAIMGNTVIRLTAVPSASIRAIKTPHAPAHISPITRNLRTTDIFICVLLSFSFALSCKVSDFPGLLQIKKQARHLCCNSAGPVLSILHYCYVQGLFLRNRRDVCRRLCLLAIVCGLRRRLPHGILVWL